MINRVLIRLKVVQLLYSHLLSDSSFQIETPLENPTREQRFAYQLYVDTLALMVRVARSIKKRGGEMPLVETQFIENVSTSDSVRGALERGRMSGSPFSSIESSLTDSVRESAIYKRFVKDENEGERQRVWEEIFTSIILPSEGYNAVVGRMEGYTLHGFERMRAMMTRTFTNFYTSGGGTRTALVELRRSLLDARRLYIRLLSLPVALTWLRERQLDENRHKYLATPEDLNPNLRFVENRLVSALREDTVLQENVSSLGCNWIPQDEGIVARLLKAIVNSEVYRAYMENPSAPGLKEDAELWRDLFKQVIFRNEDFLESLEEKSVFWNDDFEIVGEFLLKTLKRFGENGKKRGEEGMTHVMPMYKDKEDELFGEDLFRKALMNRPYYQELINESVKGSNWDAQRLAFMDVVILYCALAEILNFPKIPLKVSIGEYVEIAKFYSTPRSKDFVYAQLMAITDRLRESGKLHK